jgi:sortase A
VAGYVSRSFLLRLSTACIAAGALLLIAPAAWVLYSGREASEIQTAALASWDAGRPGGSAGSTVSSGGLALVLTIPRLGVRRFVPEGATPDHLRRYGVGRISWTSLPGQPGIVGIAGHRTTYGAPFFGLDRLRPGDTITVEYDRRRFSYQVDRQMTVAPERADVLDGAAGGSGIALVTCSPPYSAALRLIVFGTLEAVTAASPTVNGHQ